jgi:GDP-L-fucose synthase
MEKDDKIYIAGHRGLVGSSIYRKCIEMGYQSVLTRTHDEMDLMQQGPVNAFFEKEKPDYVFLAAAKVGGISANNTYPAEFIYKNLVIQTNVLHAAYQTGVKRVLFLGSSCIYPKRCPQPMREEYLLTGPLESTNQPYAIAKIAGVAQCEAYNRQYGTHFLAAMPTNLYGINDTYDLKNSHVLPALIRKFHLAKLAVNGDWEKIEHDASKNGEIPMDIRSALFAIADQKGHPIPFQYKDLIEATLPAAVPLWGSGRPRREFLYVDDLADACVFLINMDDEQFGPLCKGSQKSSFPLVNIGCGEDQTIKELARVVAEIVGYDGDIFWNDAFPDGTPQKRLDVSLMSSLGWKPSISLSEGIRRAYHGYLQGAVL